MVASSIETTKPFHFLSSSDISPGSPERKQSPVTKTASAAMPLQVAQKGDNGNDTVDEWFEAIDCDDEEFVGAMLKANPGLLNATFNASEYDEEVADLASDLLGKEVGPLTPLQYACFVESEDSALVLADACTDEQLNQKWGAQNTLLHLVAFNGMETVLRKLLKRGLPPNIMNKLGYRPMDCVANDATRDVFANFRDEDIEDAPAPIESKPKKMVDKTELPKMVPKAAPTDINTSFESINDDDSEYQTPVYPSMRTIDFAAQPKKPSTKQANFTKKKAKIQFDAETTFFDACRNGELDLVKEYITSKKISPNSKTFLGITALHMAVESESLDLVKYLVEQGANVTAVDVDGWSPLHLACSLDQVEIFKYLVSQGADVNAQTKEGEYTLELAESEEMSKAIKETKGFNPEIITIVLNKPDTDEDEDDEDEAAVSPKKGRRTD